MPDSNASLDSVDVRTASDAWAVGNYGYDTQATVILHWDGRSWSQATGPTTSGMTNRLDSVHAITASDAWAVGQFGGGALLLHWDGGSWTTIASPTTYTFDSLLGVDAGDGIALAVGLYLDPDDHQHGLRLRWDGTWSEI